MRGPDSKHPQWIREFYDNGQIEWNIPLDENGKRHGVAEQFYDDGSPKLTRTAVHGREEGRETLYYRDGKVAHTLDFVNGLQHGEYVRYDPDGTVIERARYEEGILVKT